MSGRRRRTFPLEPRRRLAGTPFGGRLSLHRGAGSDIAGLRAYRPDDPPSTIDWRASARLSAARGSDEFVVRERYTDEAPRIVVVCDRRPEMELYPPPFPWLAKPDAVRSAVEAIVLSGVDARCEIAWLDHGDGAAFWEPPRARALEAVLERFETAPYAAPPDAIVRAFEHLHRTRAALPAGSFVFVLSDFGSPPSTKVWLRAAARRWELVPVVVSDPVWEQSFPDVAGTVLPVARVPDGRVAEVRFTRAEVAERRAENEARFSRLLGGLRGIGLDPVMLDSAREEAVDAAFAAWGERRRLARRRLA